MNGQAAPPALKQSAACFPAARALNAGGTSDAAAAAAAAAAGGEEPQEQEQVQQLSRGHVVVIGATNRPDALDPALRRAGR
jgi:SpoVK/Ycf46/Vps4 family AAA+-type ATPase